MSAQKSIDRSARLYREPKKLRLSSEDVYFAWELSVMTCFVVDCARSCFKVRDTYFQVGDRAAEFCIDDIITVWQMRGSSRRYRSPTLLSTRTRMARADVFSSPLTTTEIFESRDSSSASREIELKPGVSPAHIHHYVARIWHCISMSHKISTYSPNFPTSLTQK